MARPFLHRSRLCAGALAAAGLVLSGVPVAAQQVEELRGAVQEGSVADQLLPRAEMPVQAETQEETSQAGSAPQGRRAAAAELDETPTGAVRAPRLDTLDEERNDRVSADNERVAPVEPRNRLVEDNPYAPLGIRLGTFVFTPRLDQGIGWTSNANTSPGGGSAVFSESALRLDAVSDWSRHSMTLNADGSYRRSLSGEDISEVEGGVSTQLLLDLAHGFSARGAAGYRVRPESATAPSAIVGVDSRPLRHTFTGSAGVARDVGRLRVGLTGDVLRDVYGDATLTDGTVVAQDERDSTLATATLRLGYEVSPALRPFVEGEAGRRYYDRKVDDAGYARSADRYSVRAGVEVDLREKLTGEVAAGWLTERPDDDRLANISGFVATGRLGWSPVRGTLVELTGSTQVEGSTTPGETGSLLYSGNLAVTRDIRANLSGRVLLGVDWRDYSGSDARDVIVRGEASLTWWMNRNLGVTGRARHELQRSNIASRDYDATSVYLGMTLQR